MDDIKKLFGPSYEEMEELKHLTKMLKFLSTYALSLTGTIETLMNSVDELHRIPPEFWGGLELVQAALTKVLCETVDKAEVLENYLR